MKTTIKLTLFTMLLSLPFCGFAQSGFTQATDMDVNGIFIGGKYTKAQVTAKWGTPTKYWSGMSEFGLDEEYYYTSNLFRFSDTGIFGEFQIDTPNFVVFTSKNGGIKVGDDVSRIEAIGLGTPLLQRDRPGVFIIPSGDDRFTVGFALEGKTNKITWISFVSPI